MENANHIGMTFVLKSKFLNVMVMLSSNISTLQPSLIFALNFKSELQTLF